MVWLPLPPGEALPHRFFSPLVKCSSFCCPLRLPFSLLGPFSGGVAFRTRGRWWYGWCIFPGSCWWSLLAVVSFGRGSLCGSVHRPCRAALTMFLSKLISYLWSLTFVVRCWQLRSKDLPFGSPCMVVLLELYRILSLMLLLSWF